MNCVRAPSLLIIIWIRWDSCVFIRIQMFYLPCNNTKILHLLSTLYHKIKYVLSYSTYSLHSVMHNWCQLDQINVTPWMQPRPCINEWIMVNHWWLHHSSCYNNWVLCIAQQPSDSQWATDRICRRRYTNYSSRPALMVVTFVVITFLLCNIVKFPIVSCITLRMCKEEVQSTLYVINYENKKTSACARQTGNHGCRVLSL